MAEHNGTIARRSTSLPQSGRIEAKPKVGYSSMSKRALRQMAETSDDEDIHSEGKRHHKRQKIAARHHYSGPPPEVFLSERVPQRTVSPLSSVEGEADTAQLTVEKLEKLSSRATPRRGQPAPGSQQRIHQNGPPPGRTKRQQRDLDRTAVKTSVTNDIEISGHKFAKWNSEQRWLFIQDKRQDKLRAREAEGRGTLRKWFPFDGDEQIELAYLRKQFALHLSEDVVVDPTRARDSHHGDDDDEEVIVKREDGEEAQPQCGQPAYVNNGYDIVPRRAAAAKTEGRLREPSTPSSDEAEYTPVRHPTFQHGHSIDGQPIEMTQDGPVSFITRGSTTISDVIDPDWRQYWEINAEGCPMLITPRIWRWNDKCQLVEWPPLNQIMPPLESRPDQPGKEEKKRERAVSASGR